MKLHGSPLKIREIADQPAEVRCETCADVFCEVCYAAQHRKGSRKLHVVKPLSSLEKPSPAAAVPPKEEDAVSSFAFELDE